MFTFWLCSKDVPSIWRIFWQKILNSNFAQKLGYRWEGSFWSVKWAFLKRRGNVSRQPLNFDNWRCSPDQRNSIHSRKEDTTDRQQKHLEGGFNEIFPWSYHPLCAPFGEIIVIGLSCSLYGLCQRCAQRAQRSLSVDMPSESVGNAGQYRVKPNWIEIDTCESIYLMARICPKRTIKWNNAKKAWKMY